MLHSHILDQRGNTERSRPEWRQSTFNFHLTLLLLTNPSGSLAGLSLLIFLTGKSEALYFSFFTFPIYLYPLPKWSYPMPWIIFMLWKLLVIKARSPAQALFFPPASEKLVRFLWPPGSSGMETPAHYALKTARNPERSFGNGLLLTYRLAGIPSCASPLVMRLSQHSSFQKRLLRKSFS